MEGWCELISLYPENPDPKHLTKALRTADTLIATDLASFEIEWLIQTFLYKPIGAINTIILKRTKEDWHKNIADIFKIISKIVAKYWIFIQKENEKLVQICQLPFDPQTRKEAIYCLMNILKNPGADVGDALSMINALESDTPPKAPLALLVGSLCRYCPESVDQNYNRIWRIFLNILQAQNKTDTIMNAVLQGIGGLLENFGRDISIQELQCFYQDFSRKCAKISKCIEPLLSILKSHSALFREKLVEDKVLRLYVWSINSPNIRDALLAIYTVIFADVPKERIEIIIRSEIRSYVYSELTLVKHTAFRIIINAKIYYGIQTSLVPRPDHLEFQMRYRRISHQETDLVSLCLESQESYVKSLLMSALMYYEHVPIALRRDLVVKGIQNSSPEARKVTLILLIELCKQDGCLDKYADIWRDILDTENKGDMILKETLQIMASQLKSLTENPIKDIKEVLSLSNVLCFILSASETYDPCQYSEVLKSSIDDLAACMCVCPSVILSSKYLCVEMFKSRSILKELLSSFKNDLDDHTLLIIQMVFNNIKTESKLQVKALSELDRLLKSKDGLDQRQVADIIKKIVKLKTKKTVTTSDSRILQRDLTMFIGEHGDKIEKEDFSARVYSLDLKNKITLNIPNITEGTNYKLDLLRMVQICLQWADFEMLYCLLVVITANLRDRSDPTLQSMTWECVHALYSSDGYADVTSAIRMCVTMPCVQLAIQSIKEERISEVRKKLCQSLQVMLLHDPGSEANGELLTLVAEELVVMLKSTEESLYQSGIDIAKIYLQTLHNHDNLTITYLPKIFIESSRKIDKDLYKISTDMFIEKIDIFDEIQIKEICSALFKCTFKNYNRIDLQYILQFLKRIFDIKCYEFDYFVNEMILGLDASVEGVNRDNNFESLSNLLQTLALSKPIFNLNEDEIKSIIAANNFVIINQINALLDEKVNINILRNILKFITELSDELLNVKTEQTIKCCCKLIENTTPKTLFLIKKELYDLSLCLRKNTSVLPEEINHCCQKWCEKINLNEITACFHDPCDVFAVSDTLDNYSDSIQSLSVMAKIFDCRITHSAELTTLLIKHAGEIRQSIVTDLLSISEQSLTLSEFGNILETDIEFVQKYMHIFFKKLLVYSESETVYSTVFVSAVKYFADNYKSYEQYYENIVGLFDKVFPKFELMDFKEQLLVASDIYRLPRTDEIPLLIQWARRTITAEDTSLSHKIQITTVLPGGEEYSVCYRYMASLLPVRLSEVQGDHAAILRCLLDSLASCGDLTLLDIIVTLAAADETKGWWDDAMDACMASLSDRRDEKIFDAAYNACKKRADLGGCTRVFVPLLRHSSRTYCEEYACKIIIDVLETFKRGFIVPSNTELYRERVLSYAKAFTILQVIIDKVPSKNLESGIINMSAGYQDAWHVIKDVCVYSVTLRDKVRCPDNATDAIKEACLRLQCSAYNCLTSAICKRRPSQKQYTAVFNLTAWSNVVDTGVQYDFTPRSVWNDNRVKRNSDAKTTSATTSTFTGTVRTRLFMATLSENPLQYDMIPNYEEEEEVEEDRPEPYENHPLNAYGILSTITELLVHATTLHHTEWLDTLTMALSTSPVNVKWTLAQAICNAELALKPHASVLAPALLELVATTPKLMGGTQVLNNLHIDMLWTIMRWEIKELSSYDNLNVCIQLNIATCIEFRLQDGIFRRMLSTLNNLLQMFGGNVDIEWSFLQNYCNDLPNNASYLLPILQRVLKNGIPLPGLLSLYDRFDPRVWTSTSKLPEVFALALSLEDNKRSHLIKFRQLLMNFRNISIGGYVKILLYTQKICWECCDLNNLRIIVDLAPKVEKAKCLSIIATYLENMEQDEDGFCAEMFDIIGLKELLDGDCVVEAMKVVHGGLKLMDSTLKNDLISSIKMNCHNCSAKVRKEAYRVMLKVFQDIVLVKPSHSAKRKAVENTPILDIFSSQPDHHDMMAVIADGIFDGDEEIADMMRDGVEGCLSKDMTIRFAELFFIIFNFAKNDFSELSDYGYVFLDLLFRDLRQQEGFKNKKLSDQPLPTENDNDFRMSLSTETFRSIDVQMLLTDIFQVFLESAKSNSHICEELLIEIMKRLKGTGRRFDFDETIGKLLTEVLKKEPNCLTPYYIEATRILLNNIAPIDEFKNTLNVLKSKVQDSDCSAHFGVLYEDWMLKCQGRDLFNFSFKEDDIVMNDNQEFSIEGLTEVFGLLSNWEDLRIQDRKRVEESLPPLLIEAAEFESSLKEYFETKQTFDYSTWFNKMVGAYCSSNLGKPIVQYKEHWLKDAEKWPPRDYATSAVLEAIRLFSNDAEFRSCEIKPSECLAEWAARLMIRSSYFNEDPGLSVRCRADELQFCREANIRSLPKIALQCIERNKDSLLEDEALSWFHEKVVAHRTLALRNNDLGMLQKALDATERQNVGDNVCLQKIFLQLHYDLGKLSKPKLDEILININRNVSTDKGVLLSNKNVESVRCVYDMAMNYYDGLWQSNDKSTQEDIISSMLDIIYNKLNYNLFTDHNLLIAILWNKLINFDGILSENLAQKLLELIAILEPNLDVYSKQYIRIFSNIFPTSIHNKYSDTDGNEPVYVCKQYLQLIRDPQYALLHYCDKLFYAKDQENYKTTFNDMKNKLFENKHGGTEYKSLNTIKNKLYGIENVDNIVSRHRVLKNIMDELKSKVQRSVLRLSQLSPELTKPSIMEIQRTSFQALLGLPTNVYVVKFLEQIQVFKDAIRRPCVLTAVLSNGTMKRYILKSGEPLYNDASVQRAIAILPKLCRRKVTSYNVTALAEDAAIIEYLEDHERLRELMGDTVNVPMSQRLADDKLVSSPSLALEQFRELCNKVPLNTLRSAIENRCASVQEFIRKKQTFLETLCSMTVTNWLFGVGDRHLQNILIDKKDGGLCGVDWSSTFHYGLREYVPARLTHNILAVFDATVLESRLQSMLLCLRENYKIYEAFINISFHWRGNNFHEMNYISNILRGSSVSYQITRKVLEEKNVRLKEEYIKTLDSVFEDYPKQHIYSVEEQVRCLLKHCTDERILSITPQGWEAWL